MKPTRRIAPLCALFLALLSLPSCAVTSPDPPNPPAEADTLWESDRASYLTQISELTDTILSLQAESYITKAEYEARISALLQEIAALKARLDLMDSPDGGADLPVGGSPAETQPHTTPAEPPASMAFHYEIRDGRAVILAYLGDETRVKIPASIEGYPVTAIEEAAFRATPVVSVEIPYSVTEIGWFAFADCQSLQSVNLPASVESIGYGAFDGSPNLTVICPADSYAARYAASFGLPHKEE